MSERVESEALLEGAIRVARKLADGPTRALVATRQLLDASEQATFVELFTAEIRVQAVMRDSADALDGRQAFAERRPARFREVRGLRRARSPTRGARRRYRRPR